MDLDAGLLREAFLQLIIVACSLALHEWGHAIVADRLGDDTPRSQGRVTLNPLAHIDPIGTLVIPLMGMLGFFGSFGMIGWAKPIETNPSRYRNRYRSMALVTLAGPGMNVLLALLATVVAALFNRFSLRGEELLILVLRVNVSLAVFNMIPLPPLDGSKFLIYWFGMSEETYQRIAVWSQFLLLLLVNIPQFRQLLGMLIALASIPFSILYGLLT
jgi:Zn-dependent protease